MIRSGPPALLVLGLGLRYIWNQEEGCRNAYRILDISLGRSWRRLICPVVRFGAGRGARMWRMSCRCCGRQIGVGKANVAHAHSHGSQCSTVWRLIWRSLTWVMCRPLLPVIKFNNSAYFRRVFDGFHVFIKVNSRTFFKYHYLSVFVTAIPCVFFLGSGHGTFKCYFGYRFQKG